MSKFPSSIPLPDSVLNSRMARRKEMTASARKGLILRLCVISMELMGFVFLNSSALLLDALSSLIDVASTLFLIFFIRWADRPPDEKHPFGHGRAEPIAGLQLGLLLAVIGAGMLFQQGSALLHGAPGKAINPYTWIIGLGAIIILEIGYRIVRRTAKKENSPALLADALHYRIDAVSSLLATIALIFAAYFPSWSVAIDHLGAIAIALMMIVVGSVAAYNNIHQLLDRIPDKKYFKLVHRAALKVPGVLATEKVRLQVYGPDAHVSIDIEVDPNMSVEVAHEITQKVRTEIQKEWPAVRDVIVHVEPHYPNDHPVEYDEEQES